MATAWLSLGSNVNARANIAGGMQDLARTFDAITFSPVYTSKAVGFCGDDFINLVARVDTAMSPLELRDYLRSLEDRFGRKRNVPKFSDRTLDIDILLYDDLIVYSPRLQIPRYEILKFAHVLKPLADLDPALVHPVERRTISEIWETSGLDGSGLELMEWP